MTQLRNKQQGLRPKVAATPRGLQLIGIFKLFKGAVLFAVGIGVAKLLHKDLGLEVERWADILRVDPSNDYIQRLLGKFSMFDNRKLKELSAGTFFYSALFFTEGIGLLSGKRWAEYFTIIVTSSFLPIEFYEITMRVSLPRIAFLIINIAVVVYLVAELYGSRKKGEINAG